MANKAPDRPVGLADWHDYLETDPLKLKAENFPLPCSLRSVVVKLYANRDTGNSVAVAMDTEELLSYLRNIEDHSLTPLEGILAQTEAIGDPALPTTEQTAILDWLGAAINDWEQRFALEEPLAGELRRLKPLLAAVAITDPEFLTPGIHPLHQLLDTIQLNAIGWQPRLGRAGQALEKQVNGVIGSVLEWFDSSDTDLASICSNLGDSAKKDQARTKRMAQRLIETQQGRIKTFEAKRQAAQMINAALEQFQTTSGIGEFLKGPWYDSAQLVLLKFGVDSDQWRQMSATTTTLLDSLHTPAEPEPDRRQQLFEVVTQLPKDLRRWLLSLQHDSEAVGDAVGAVEFAHLHILRQQELELEQVAPIPVADSKRLDQGLEETLERLKAGQWFSLDTGDGHPLRARLVLRMDGEQQLLFANQVGIKVLQQSFSEFAALLAKGKVTLLDTGASFSRSLARSAGIESRDDLETLTGAAAERIRLEKEALQEAEEARLQAELAAARRQQQEREEAQRLQREREQAEQLEAEQAELARQQQEQEQAEADELQREWDEAQRLQRERQEFESQQVNEKKAAELKQQELEAERLREQQQRAEEFRNEQLQIERREEELREQAAHLKEQQEEQEQQEKEQRTRELLEKAQRHSERQNHTAPAPTAGGLDLPMGAWVGFHDGDKPLLAKLAVHDREQASYTFVNRSGIKMRQLSGRELRQLIENGLVDILETRSKFREETTRARVQDEDK